MLVRKQSPFSGEWNEREIAVSAEKLAAWDRDGGASLIQNFFPELSLDEREFILTGTTPEEFEEIFAGVDDDDATGGNEDAPAF